MIDHDSRYYRFKLPACCAIIRIMLSLVLLSTAVLLYLLSSYLLAARLARGAAGISTDKSRILVIGLAAVLLHGLLLYQGLFTESGLNLGFFNASSLITWLVVLLLLVTAFTKPIESLGIVLLPLAAAALVLETAYPSQHLVPGSTNFGLKTHIVVSIFSYSLLSLAAVQAVLLAVQDHHLRHRHPGGFIRALPPLQTMEHFLFRMIILGFILLSLSLFSGFMFLEDMFAQHLVHKTVLSLLAWAVFAILLYGRWRFGWRGTTAIRWTLAGFVVLMLAYFGSKLVLELVLQRPV